MIQPFHVDGLREGGPIDNAYGPVRIVGPPGCNAVFYQKGRFLFPLIPINPDGLGKSLEILGLHQFSTVQKLKFPMPWWV